MGRGTGDFGFQPTMFPLYLAPLTFGTSHYKSKYHTYDRETAFKIHNGNLEKKQTWRLNNSPVKDLGFFLDVIERETKCYLDIDDKGQMSKKNCLECILKYYNEIISMASQREIERETE